MESASTLRRVRVDPLFPLPPIKHNLKPWQLYAAQVNKDLERWRKEGGLENLGPK